jgi:hypothetical protein
MDRKEDCDKLEKDYNPKNGKCVDRCGAGKERNPKTFRCVNIKKKRKPKTSKRSSPKLLSQVDCDKLEKDYNSKNNKCVDRCGAGKERNPKTFRCVNIKKKRTSKPSSKRVRRTSREPNQTECNKISRRLAELERVFKEQHPEAYAKMFAQKK